MRAMLLVTLLVVLIAGPAATQDSAQIALSVSPEVMLPLGSARPFVFGMGAALDASFQLARTPRMAMQGRFAYSYLSPGADPASSSITGSSLISLAPGVSYRLGRSERTHVRLRADLGYGLVSYQELLGSNAYAAAGVELAVPLGASLAVRGTAGYQYRAQLPDLRTFLQGPVAGIAVAYRPGASTRSRLDIVSATAEPVFPVFYSHYDTHPFGTLILRNGERGPVRNLSVALFVPGYMNRARTVSTTQTVAEGEEVRVPLTALFSPAMLGITSATKLPAEITVGYDYLDTEKHATFDLSLEVQHRNALTWDDSEKVAAFVTPTDPRLLRYARPVASLARTTDAPAINSVFRQAVALLEALRIHGMSYIPDPTTPYRELSATVAAVDYVQFPVESLQYRTGDCDDLSVLYVALLESVGIETAFITVPGHILVAFAVGWDEAHARRVFVNANDLIFSGGQCWLPVEVTALDRGFNAAWHEGARVWKRYADSSEAALLPVRDAWSRYEPVELSDDVSVDASPSVDRVMTDYRAEIERFVNDQIGDLVARLRDQIASTSRPDRYRNRLGIVFAQYGRRAEAMRELQIAADDRYRPARVNLANLHALEEQYETASRIYDGVLQEEPENVAALVGYAKVCHKLEMYRTVRQSYETLRTVDPTAATEIAYLVDGETATTRASEAVRTETFLWQRGE